MKTNEKIVVIRKSKKLSQEYVGFAIHKDASEISRYETGKVEPSIPTLLKLAEVFKVNVNDLLGSDHDYMIVPKVACDEHAVVNNIYLELHRSKTLSEIRKAFKEHVPKIVQLQKMNEDRMEYVKIIYRRIGKNFKLIHKVILSTNQLFAIH